MSERERDKQQAAVWAHEMMHRKTWCVLDTETTGIGSHDEIVQIAVVNWDKEILLNTLVRPKTQPIGFEASQIHGIYDRDVEDAPTFDGVFFKLLQAVGDREVVIYNASFDVRLIGQSLRPYGVHFRPSAQDTSIAPGLIGHCIRWINGAPVVCAMDLYSQWVGDWSDYHHDYRWQKLPGGDHTAVGDCMAVHRLIERMATPQFSATSSTLEPEQPIEPVGAKLVEMPTIAASVATEEYDDIPF